jgi:hypothetical protein
MILWSLFLFLFLVILFLWLYTSIGAVCGVLLVRHPVAGTDCRLRFLECLDEKEKWDE